MPFEPHHSCIVRGEEAILRISNDNKPLCPGCSSLSMAKNLNSHGPAIPLTSGVVVNIVSWFFLIVSVLAISARIIVKWSACRRFYGDDILALLALVRWHSGRALSHFDTNPQQSGLQHRLWGDRLPTSLTWFRSFSEISQRCRAERLHEGECDLLF